MSLTLFPVRAAIGQFPGPDKRPVYVYQTIEFSRALAEILKALGGDSDPIDSASLALESGVSALAFDRAEDTAALELVAVRAELADALAALSAVTNAAASLLARVEEAEAQVQPVATAPNWAAPGRVGSTAPNSGAFTTLTATAGFGCNGQPQQPAYALGGAAVDLATALTLVNNLRNLCIANGTGT